MKPVVLIIYVILVLAVVGQAVHLQNEAAEKPAELQVRELPNRSDGAEDTALDRTERTHETDKDRTESTRGDAIRLLD